MHRRLVHRLAFEELEANNCVSLGFHKLETVGGVRFSLEDRNTLTSGIGEAYLRDLCGCSRPPSKTELQRMIRSAKNDSQRLAKTLEKIAAWMEPDKDNARFLRSHAASIRRLTESLEEGESKTDGMPPRPGRRVDRKLRILARAACRAYHNAGGRALPYWEDTVENYEGPFLDLLQELLDQLHYPYKTRQALGTFIKRNRNLFT